MNSRNCFILFVFFALTGWSCKKFVDIDPPPTRAESIKIFEQDESAISAAIGLYSKMLSSSLNTISGGAALYTAMSSDELINTAPNTVNDAFRTNSLLPTTGNYALNFWTLPYNYIFHANSVLEGLEASATLSDSVRHQLKGEMLLTRSLLYFYLVNFFGDVPLVTTTDYRINSSMPRTAQSIIYQRIISDVLLAQYLLKESYPSANRFRPNKYTATALLARLYLYTGQYSLADSASNAIIQSGKYSLAPLANVFSGASSNETIWQLMRDNGNTNEAGSFIPFTAGSRPGFQLTTQLFVSFEANDQRKLTTANGWLGKITVSGVDYYYPNKYKLRALSSGTAPTEFLIVFRLAEQYLIRAESRLHAGNISGAIQDLNIIRVRAGLPALSLLLPAEQTRLAIQQERRIEFFAEWGHRWLDLKRTGMASSVLAPIKGAAWQDTDVLYPLPQSEMNVNPFLTQNPGY
ncbi:MAG TPA: RagB/SusD family nutrient uptake outer membrane protein [Chitinophagaceae bacterium]|jgi:hypothetical protein|nr:RagB/SusD family nutrient uptake outer membrane protein [Chitinophagaceae bacterium]